ncbi:MAG: cytochrome b/b6 domain-containing protein [Alphaproteobacteria bacterium]|nr:cytochrome b/b6 domain-containing protein [Alphaproteobacteria bacterium]
MNDPTNAAVTAQSETLKVWDPLIRASHWLLVAAFGLAYVLEDDFLTLHSWAGYTVAGVVAVRVAWGFVGPRRARFSDFLTGPGKAMAYFLGLLRGTSPRHVGHSPAGGIMILALLLSLTGTALSGMATLAEEKGQGPLAPYIAHQTQTPEAREGDEEGEGRRRHKKEGVFEEVHEFFANFTVFLVILHVGGVLLASQVHGENLTRSMVTGRKRP